MLTKFVGTYNTRKKQLSIRKTKKDRFDPFFSSAFKITFYFESDKVNTYSFALATLHRFLSSIREDVKYQCSNIVFIKTKDDEDAD